MTAPDPSPYDAPHGAPGQFWNPWRQLPVAMRDLLRWKLLSANAYAAERRRLGKRGLAATLDPERRSTLEPIASGRAAATWVGHATFVLQEGDDVIVTDPHWGPRALIPRRLVEPGLPLAALPENGLVVLSHDHYDHLDRWTVQRMPRGFTWFVPWGLKRWFERFTPEVAPRVQEFDWWQSAEWGRFRVTFVPAQHWSNRLAHPRFSTLWGGWVIEGPERRLYFSGDSGYFGGFAEIGRRFPKLDVAFLPIGAYEPRWFMQYQHLDPAESLQAFRDLGARRMVGMHWGVFDLTDEPPSHGPRVLEPLLSASERAVVHVPRIGGRIEY